ncbi:MAG: TIGR03621 family F420-dependent LLM class oxidoreductase [Acidimicrobiia bacterium]
MPAISFALQAQLTDGASWASLARNAEQAGFEAFVVPDHPGTTASPFVALAAAAAATSSIAVGTYVCNTGVRDPVQLAVDAATLDLVSGGRVQLGLGAGHTPAEWAANGTPYPSSADRITRLIEVTGVIERLLAGETVTFDGTQVTTADAVLTTPRPTRAIPLLLGGSNRRLLEFAGTVADIVGIAGLGRTLADGHSHQVRWTAAAVDASINTIRAAAEGRSSRPRIDALVQHVEVTDDARAAAERVAEQVPDLEPDDVLSCPFVLIGRESALVEELQSHHDRWGIDRFTVRADAFDVVARLVARLA